MGRYAEVRNGIVENVSIWDGDESKWTPPVGATMIDVTELSVGPGWTHDGNAFSPPQPVEEEPQPEQVTGEQLLYDFHDGEQRKQIIRAKELAADLARGDPDGALDAFNFTPDQLEALQSIGDWFAFRYEPKTLYPTNALQPVLEAIKTLDIYGDKPPEDGKLPPRVDKEATLEGQVEAAK